MPIPLISGDVTNISSTITAGNFISRVSTVGGTSLGTFNHSTGTYSDGSEPTADALKLSFEYIGAYPSISDGDTVTITYVPPSASPVSIVISLVATSGTNVTYYLDSNGALYNDRSLKEPISGQSVEQEVTTPIEVLQSELEILNVLRFTENIIYDELHASNQYDIIESTISIADISDSSKEYIETFLNAFSQNEQILFSDSHIQYFEIRVEHSDFISIFEDSFDYKENEFNSFRTLELVPINEDSNSSIELYLYHSDIYTVSDQFKEVVDVADNTTETYPTINENARYESNESTQDSLTVSDSQQSLLAYWEFEYRPVYPPLNIVETVIINEETSLPSEIYTTDEVISFSETTGIIYDFEYKEPETIDITDSPRSSYNDLEKVTEENVFISQIAIKSENDITLSTIDAIFVSDEIIKETTNDALSAVDLITIFEISLNNYIDNILHLDEDFFFYDSHYFYSDIDIVFADNANISEHHIVIEENLENEVRIEESITITDIPVEEETYSSEEIVQITQSKRKDFDEVILLSDYPNLEEIIETSGYDAIESIILNEYYKSTNDGKLAFASDIIISDPDKAVVHVYTMTEEDTGYPDTPDYTQELDVGANLEWLDLELPVNRKGYQLKTKVVFYGKELEVDYIGPVYKMGRIK